LSEVSEDAIGHFKAANGISYRVGGAQQRPHAESVHAL
jgi:hypothetical protein